MKVLKNKIILILAFFLLAGCQTSSQKLPDLLTGIFKPGKSHENLSKDDPKQSFFGNFLDRFKPSKIEDETIRVSQANPAFKAFKQSNAFYNIMTAVKSHPSVQSAMSNVKSAKMNIRTVESGKNTQVNFQALSGVSRDNSSNTFGAVGSLNISRLLFDYGATDNTVLSQKKRYQLSKVQAEIAAETVALRGYEVWINLHRQKKVMEVYRGGMSLAEPILGQIKTISLSGLADKAMILKAQQDYSKLEVAYSRSSAELAAAKALFDEVFPNGRTDDLQALKTRQITQGKIATSTMLKKSPALRAQDFLIDSFEAEYKTLKAQKNANVSMSAGVTAPAKDTIKDGSANVGILVNYVFNDGGRLDSQILSLKEKIKEVKKQKQAIERELKSQLNVAIETYLGVQKTYDATLELVNLSEEVRDTSKDQLVSGRSKIQEVLNAEVTLAENKIQLVNAEAELKLASYRIRALTHGLTKEIGWKPF
ncbi:MAG: hypothetical protein CML39_01610 [Rhodobacteraceae bacterium]|nr:MAG: hypothetical protein CML39_01610 [Paracoccaceae bacterium]